MPCNIIYAAPIVESREVTVTDSTAYKSNSNVGFQTQAVKIEERKRYEIRMAEYAEAARRERETAQRQHQQNLERAKRQHIMRATSHGGVVDPSRTATMEPAVPKTRENWKVELDTPLTYEEQKELNEQMEKMGYDPKDLIVPVGPKKSQSFWSKAADAFWLTSLIKSLWR